jgi:hypothetical protein
MAMAFFILSHSTHFRSLSSLISGQLPPNRDQFLIEIKSTRSPMLLDVVNPIVDMYPELEPPAAATVCRGALTEIPFNYRECCRMQSDPYDKIDVLGKINVWLAEPGRDATERDIAELAQVAALLWDGPAPFTPARESFLADVERAKGRLFDVNGGLNKIILSAVGLIDREQRDRATAGLKQAYGEQDSEFARVILRGFASSEKIKLS